MTEDDLADFLPMTLSAGEYQGDKYQLPLYYEALLFLYNKDLMETAPETTDELLELMKNETTAISMYLSSSIPLPISSSLDPGLWRLSDQ